MKKTFFSLLGGVIVITTVLFACSKTDTNGIAVTYASQGTAGTGHNNGSAGGSTAGSLTAGTTGGTTTGTVSSVTIGTTQTTITPNPCNVAGGIFTVGGASTTVTCNASFLGTPVAGNYTVVPNATALTTSNAHLAVVQGGTSYDGQSGTIAVSLVGGKVKAVFNSIPCLPALTVSGTIQCP